MIVDFSTMADNCRNKLADIEYHLSNQRQMMAQQREAMEMKISRMYAYAVEELAVARDQCLSSLDQAHSDLVQQLDTDSEMMWDMDMAVQACRKPPSRTAPNVAPDPTRDRMAVCCARAFQVFHRGLTFKLESQREEDYFQQVRTTTPDQLAPAVHGHYNRQSIVHEHGEQL